MKKTRLLSFVLALVMLVSCFCGNFVAEGANGTTKSATIDNSSLMPKYVPDSKVEVDANGTPKWVETAIIACVNLNTATPEGTLESSVKVLDHYAEMGINCIWLTPVYDPGSVDKNKQNGYENMGPRSINPRLTGTDDYTEGWKRLGKFIDKAHQKNIRIILDVISWGVRGESPLVTEHPEFISNSNGSGGYYFNWKNDAFVEYYISSFVDIAMVTGCDGFRYDTEPSYAGYEVDGAIRQRLWDKGRKPFMMSENENERGVAYDIGQSGLTEGVSHENYKSVEPIYFWLDKYNIVESIKNGEHYGTQGSQDLGFGGTYHYYTCCITNHDNKRPVVKGNRAAVGYQAMYTPFIPVLLLGEEFNNPNHYDNPNDSSMYFNSVDWSLLEDNENKALYEDIKQMIKIRRSYPELFCYYPEEFLDSNICKVNVTNCEVAQPYARYAEGEAIIVVPNNNLHEPNAKMTVYMPFMGTGLDYYKNYVVTDAVTGKLIVKGSASKVAKFTVSVPNQNERVLLVKASGKLAKPEGGGDDDDIYNNGYYDDDFGDEPIIGDVDDDGNGSGGGTEEIVVIKRRRKKAHGSEMPIWPFIAGGAALLVILGGTTFFIIFAKKRKSKEEEA